MIDWDEVLIRAKQGNPMPEEKVEKSDATWREVLSAEQYRITRQKGTEMPHSSSMCTSFSSGKYACVCCETLLFDANEKFDSGTGWPSFTQPMSGEAIAYHLDESHGMQRVEVTCNICDAHLGHVFPDGPPPSGLRFCINAVALRSTKY